MASPIPPILSSLILEALKRSGYENPNTDLQERARTRWIEEIKSELWAKERKLKSLQTRNVTTLTVGLAQYSNPSDYASDRTMSFVTGTRYGTLQAGSSLSVTLAASDAGGQSTTIGKEIIITSGTGLGGISFITGYTEATKVATVSPSFSTAPTAGSGYVVCDYYKPLTERPLWDYETTQIPFTQGYPDYFFPKGDSTNGAFVLLPVPYRNDSQPMAVIQNYYSDLTELDVAGTLMATLYQKWQQLFIAGIRWKCLQNDDDSRSTGAFQEYQKAIKDVVGAETYGSGVNSLQFRVCDY